MVFAEREAGLLTAHAQLIICDTLMLIIVCFVPGIDTMMR